PELRRLARWPWLRADDARRDRQDDLRLVGRIAPRAKQAADDRNVPEPRDVVRVTRVLIVDQAREDLCLPIAQAQDRARITCADLVRERTVGPRYLFQDRTHF